MLQVICTRLRQGQLSVRVGDSLWHSEETVKILNCDHYYHHYSPPGVMSVFLVLLQSLLIFWKQFRATQGCCRYSGLHDEHESLVKKTISNHYHERFLYNDLKKKKIFKRQRVEVVMGTASRKTFPSSFSTRKDACIKNKN